MHPAATRFQWRFIRLTGGRTSPPERKEVMPWTPGKNYRFCFASWGFVRKITTLRAEVTNLKKNGKLLDF
jgi:hypothetical protein